MAYEPMTLKFMGTLGKGSPEVVVILWHEVHFEVGPFLSFCTFSLGRPESLERIARRIALLRPS